MRSRSRSLFWVLGLVCLLSPAEAFCCDDVNVLVNPGGEAGPEPWEYVTLGSSHQVGVVTLSTGSVSATEGNAWFAADRTETAVSIGTAPLRVEQTVDVRGPRPVECVRLEADFFGVGEILEGAGTLAAIFIVRIDFYDDTSPNAIGAASLFSGPFSLASPFQTLGVQVETTDIPEGTAFVVARLQGQMNLNSSVPEVPATGRAILGADAAVMSITLPEPTAGLAGAMVWLTLLGLRGRSTASAARP